MHPDMMLELLNQHAAEAMARAREDRLVRTARAARKLARRRRDPAGASGTFTAPEIPDYIDAMFGETGQAPTQGGAPGQRAA
jgi:hypothetical protein